MFCNFKAGRFLTLQGSDGSSALQEACFTYKAIRLLCLGVSAALATSGTGFTEKYEIVRSHSTVGFSIRHLDRPKA